MDNINKHASPQTRKLLLGNKIDAKGKKVRGGGRLHMSARGRRARAPAPSHCTRGGANLRGAGDGHEHV
jgi:hypothetical protein